MKLQNAVIFTLCYFTKFLSLIECRIHRLNIESDERSYIALTSFGYYKGGYLFIKFQDFHFVSSSKNHLFGFTLEKVLNDATDPHMEIYRDRCLLSDSEKVIKNKENVVFFTMDLNKNRLLINCSANSDIEKLRIYEDVSQLPITSHSEQASIKDGKKHENKNVENKNLRGASCINHSLPISLKYDASTGITYYGTQFAVYVPTEHEEGLYELFFHNCANYKENVVVTFFSIFIEEYNVGNYLSAGEMPLPALYFMMSIIFFLSALFWIYILLKSRHPVFKIHYLMGALVLLKAFGLLFHGINYHYIEVKGEHVTTWAILYYVTHLLKGSVLFITIILIGTGWTFIKHILSPKDKKIFIIVIPLQVFANVAEIILEESEEGDAEHRMWLDVFTFVDLICCFAILFPIVWSIKHLQDASQTDGKAAINLQKLKLFRHFYIMIVCYIYFTRIIVYLLKMTVPFRYEWLDEMFKEIAIFVFFVLTGYKFRPASANPYFQAPVEEDDDMDIVVSQCGLTEGLTKLSRISNENAEDDKDTLLIYKRESSHDYD